MFAFVASLALLASVFAVTPVTRDVETRIQDSFHEFMVEHAKTYSNEEFLARFNTYRSNFLFVQQHNTAADADSTMHRVELNQFADLTVDEFTRVFLGYRPRPSTIFSPAPETFVPTGAVAANTTVDWRTHSPPCVTPIKNQGQCGSCWSFSTTGSIEGQHVLAGKATLVSLSEQNLVDCSQKEGNQGCNGGLMDDAFKYVIANKGIDTEASYPYTAKDGKKCLFNKANVGATISSYKDIPKGNEAALTQAIQTVGPISVAIDASHQSFQFYKSGVYNEKACSSSELDHGVLAVGFGTLSGKDYYLVKNSWGTTWGLSGYIMMSRNLKNQCGIATSASYPIV